MSKKKYKKKENLLAETVEMQKKQAMNLVAQSTVNQQLLEEIIGIKEEMDRNVKKTNQKLTDIELLVEEVNKKVHIDDGEASKIKSIVFKKAGVFADMYFFCIKKTCVNLLVLSLCFGICSKYAL